MARPKGHRKHVRVREKSSSRYAPAPLEEGLAGILLDSDVIIGILRGDDDLRATLRSLAVQGVPSYCTAVSWAEVFAGVRKGEESATESFFEARGEVVIDARAGRQAASYLARYARSHGVQLGDALIAAAAATSGFSLWTLNRKHLPMQDLRFFEPASP